MNRSITLVALMGLTVGASASASADLIVPKPGKDHPAVGQARSISRQVEGLKKRRKLKVTFRKFEHCRPGVDTRRRMYVGPGGKVRKYVYEGGTEDRAVVASFYYNTRERLVFAQVEATYHNRASVTYRVYLDYRGKRIWQKLDLKGKPRGMYSPYWPEAGMVHKPREALVAPSPCKATKL